MFRWSPFPVPLSRSDRYWLIFGLAATFCLFGFYYAAGWMRGEETSLLILYRPGVGDRDYYPLARQFGAGNFGEGFTSGLIGRDWVGFPCFSVLPHGLALRWFGPLGFAFADLITPGVYFVLAARLLMHAGASSRAALLVALFVTLQGLATLAHLIFSLGGFALHGLPFYLEFLQTWEFRFPRNFISEIYLLGALGNWCAFARTGPDRPRLWWALMAAWMSALLQSDVYAFIALALAFGAVGALHGRRFRELKTRVVVGHLTVLIGVGLAFSSLFLVQRAHVSADVLDRYGVFTLARSQAVRGLSLVGTFFPRTFTWFTLALPWIGYGALRLMGHRSLLSLTFATALTLLHVSSFLALPAMIALTGQGVQLYHFRDAARTLLAWSVVGLAAIALTAAREKIPQGWLKTSRLSLAANVLLAGIFLSLLGPVQTRAQMLLNDPGAPRAVGIAPTPHTLTYRADLLALAPELDHAAAEGARVLATLDVDLYSWWTGFRGRETFLPNSFDSALRHDVLLERLALFAVYNQIAPNDFVPWLLTEGINPVSVCWLAANRYQATPLHTFADLASYTAAERREIAATNPLDCWHLIVPAAERQRLTTNYRAILASVSTVNTPPPDLLVLLRDLPQLNPDPRRYRLAYENKTFRLFRLL